MVLGHKSCSSKLPIKLFGTRQLSSLKLVISQRPVYADTIVHNIPYTVILPSMDDDTESFAFVCDALDMFSLQFDIYPTFGSSVVGRAVVLPQEMLITTACVRASSGFLERGSGGYYAHYPVSAPLFDHRLRVVGELNFEFVVVLPFSHPKMDLGHAGVYWKATTVCDMVEGVSRVHAISVLFQFYFRLFLIRQKWVFSQRP